MERECIIVNTFKCVQQDTNKKLTLIRLCNDTWLFERQLA